VAFADTSASSQCSGEYGAKFSPAAYPHLRLRMAAVCKTAASALPATVGPPGESRPFRAEALTGCALEWMIWALYVDARI